MKKMVCEICGSTEIRKVGDGVFECQSCGVQYDTAEVKKLLVEVTGKVKIDHSEEVENTIKRAEQFASAGDNAKAEQYYNAALDLDADNQQAQQGVKEISTQRELENYFIVEPELDPQESVKRFLEQLATTDNMACDIYKQIDIRSVTEKYMTFYFMKGKYRVDWTATACHVYYENETVYKERYDKNLHKLVKEPQTEKVQKVQRVPRSGSEVCSGDGLVLASDNLLHCSSMADTAAKKALIEAFETQQHEKYGQYNVKKIDTKQVQKENDKYFYKGMELDAQVDRRVYEEKRKQMAERIGSSAEPRIVANIGGDYYEDLSGTRYIVSESVVGVCIPVQIIEYSYKGKDYTAVADLLSYTNTIPMAYPSDTEMEAAVQELEQKKAHAQKNGGLAAALWISGIGFVIMMLFAFLDELMPMGNDTSPADIFVPLGLGLMVVGLIVFAVSAIVTKVREKNFESSAETVRKTMFDPRVQALEQTKELFFKQYTDYSSAKAAAAGADCFLPGRTRVAVAAAGVLRKKMAYIVNQKVSDDVVEVFNTAIKGLQRKRNWEIGIGIAAGAAVAALGILLIDMPVYVHTGMTWVVGILVGLGVLYALVGWVFLMGKRNKKINQLRQASYAYTSRKQMEEEFADPNKAPNTLLADSGSKETAEQLAQQLREEAALTPKERLGRWWKQFKLPAIIAGAVVVAMVLLLVVEGIVCGVMADSVAQALEGNAYSRWYWSGLDKRTTTYKFQDGICQETDTYGDYEGTYAVHYDLFTGKVGFVYGYEWHDVEFDADTKEIDRFQDTWSEEPFCKLEAAPEQNETQTQPTTEATEPTTVATEPPVVRPGLFGNELAYEQVWATKYNDGGEDFTIFFLFEESGDCYVALAWGWELCAAGAGTYSVDGDTVYLDLSINGEAYDVAYRFEPSTYSWTLTSPTGILADQGHTYFLVEDSENEPEKIKNWGLKYANQSYSYEYDDI